MAKAPCVECKTRPKWGTRQRCLVCYTRSQGVTERVEASRRRLGMVPEELRKRTVPATLWPPGTRWCAGCQTFVDLKDVGKGASQCKACVSAKSHASMIQRTYGLTPEGYDELLALQGGRCAICRNRPGKKRFAVDHDHKTGAVRGLLCSVDNHDLLGAGYDSIAKLGAAVHYLEHPPATGTWWPPEDGLTVTVAREAAPAAPEATSPSKASRLADPPGARPVVERVTSPDGWPGASNSGISVAELHLLGGSKDEDGYYRLYQHRDDHRLPF